MNPDVFLSLLALDSYNRGYGQNVLLNSGDSMVDQNEAGRKIGSATIIDVPLPSGSVAAGFYAIAYNWDGRTVIAYRGTNFEINWSISDFLESPVVRDAWNGHSLGRGLAGANDNSAFERAA